MVGGYFFIQYLKYFLWVRKILFNILTFRCVPALVHQNLTTRYLNSDAKI
jgi:hypothetical protein